MGKATLDNRFVIIGDLGTGGNAQVKLAFDLSTSSQVAIKLMKELDEHTKNEVLKEVQSL